METVFSPHYALILAAISAVFFCGGYVFLFKEQRQDSKDQKQEIKDIKGQNVEIKDMLYEIKLDQQKTNMTLANTQDQSRLRTDITERGLDSLRERVTLLENIKRAS